MKIKPFIGIVLNLLLVGLPDLLQGRIKRGFIKLFTYYLIILIVGLSINAIDTSQRGAIIPLIILWMVQFGVFIYIIIDGYMSFRDP